MNLEHELQRAIKAVREAGEYLRSVSDVVVTSNAGKDIELEADLKAQDIIFSHLQRTEYSILSEHGEYQQGGKEGTTWIVDPLDGSLNFSRKIPNAAVSIALWNNEEPLFGAVYDFNRDDLYYGIVEEKSYLNEEKISVSNVPEKSDAVICTGFPSKADYATENISAFVKKVQDFKKVRLLGSAALSLAYVACGRADAYHEKGIMLWDVAAGLALVKAAGGSVVMKSLGNHQYGVFASNGKITQEN